MTKTMASQPLSYTITSGGRIALAITVSMTFVASVFVLFRLLARRRPTSVQWDDWTCVISLIIAYGFLIATALLVTIGKAGHHIAQFDPHSLMIFCQTFIASDILATSSLSLTKISLLLFYRRIFAIKSSFRIATWITGGLIFGYFVSTTLVLIFSSDPVEGEWKPWLPRTHINYRAFWVAFSCNNIALDVLILSLPQPLIWGLKLSRRRKLQVSLVFLLGAFVCATSILRLRVMIILDMDDLPYSLVPVVYWNAVEVNTGIICACLPMMPRVFRDLFRRKDTQTDSTAVSNQTRGTSRWVGKMRSSSTFEIRLLDQVSTSRTSSL
ncbi:hypothetical protein BDV12DRAFT_175109 [Aspergillus spectabilis]